MLHKEIERDNIKVEIYRQKNYTKDGYEYFLQVLTKSTFSSWVINSNYKQKNEINSLKVAITMANEFLNGVI
jgi:leucyl aminopeptidase